MYCLPAHRRLHHNLLLTGDSLLVLWRLSHSPSPPSPPAIVPQAGDTVVYSKYAGTELELGGSGGDVLVLLKEDDVIGLLAGGADIGALRPLQDRVLIEVVEAAAQTAGGLLLTEGSKEKPTMGKVRAWVGAWGCSGGWWGPVEGDLSCCRTRTRPHHLPGAAAAAGCGRGPGARGGRQGRGGAQGGGRRHRAVPEVQRHGV